MRAHSSQTPASTVDFWTLSESELSQTCLLIAEGRSPYANSILRAEALRLYVLWRDAMGSPDIPGETREERSSLLSGLRKRTIQILVRLTQIRRMPTLVR